MPQRRRAGIRGLVAAELALATLPCLGAPPTARSSERLLTTDVGVRDEGLPTLWFANVRERPGRSGAASPPG